MLEEHSYFAVMYMVWLCDDVWREYGPRIFSHVPPLMRGAVAAFVRSSVSRDLYGQVLPHRLLLPPPLAARACHLPVTAAPQTHSTRGRCAALPL